MGVTTTSPFFTFLERLLQGIIDFVVNIFGGATELLFVQNPIAMFVFLQLGIYITLFALSNIFSIQKDTDDLEAKEMLLHSVREESFNHNGDSSDSLNQ